MRRVGSWWVPEEEEHLVKYLERDDGYQLELQKLALEHTKRRGTFIDCGAHIGLWSRPMLEHFEYLIAIEPLFDDFLYRNLSDLPQSKWEIWDVALSDKKEILGFSWNPEATGSASASKIATNFQRVQASPLDLLWEIEANPDYPEVSLIKYDLEGMELEALRGSREVIGKYSPTLVIEFKKKNYRYAYQEEHTYELLFQLGYIQKHIHGDDQIWVPA